MIRSRLKSYYLVLSVSLFENSESSTNRNNISNKNEDLYEKLKSSKKFNDISSEDKSLFEKSENVEKFNNISNKFKGLLIEDKWERVKLIFEKDDMGNYHPDAEYAYQMFIYGFLIGGFLGGFLESYKNVIKYVEQNDSTLYFSNKEANRYLAKHSLKGLFGGILKTGPLFGVFIGGFTLFSCMVQAYRDKQGIIEYGFGGFFIGALLRFKYSWRGMLSGGIIGGVFGTFYGLFNYCKLKFLNISDRELRYAQLSLKKYRELWREKQLNESLKNQ